MKQTKELTLKEVAVDFSTWRRIKSPGERVPSALWQKVKCVANHYQRGKIIQTLGISTTQYRRYVLGVDKKDIPKVLPETASQNKDRVSFVKVKNPLSMQSAMLRLEFVRSDGTKLNCYYSSVEDLHQTIKWFVKV